MVNPGKKLKKIILILGITAAVYGGFRYLLPLVVPFLCAYGTALWLRPSVRYWEQKIRWRLRGKEHHMPAAAVGALEIVLILVALIGFVYFGGVRLFSQIRRLSGAMLSGLVRLDEILTGFFRWVEDGLGMREHMLVDQVRELVEELGRLLRQNSMPALMTNSVDVLTGVIHGIVVLVIYFIATLLFLQEMEEIREKKSRSLFHREFALIGNRIVKIVSAWVKTEVILSLVTAGLCIAGLLVIGNPYAFLLGLGIGILDALPLFGAGVILIPWGIILLIQKRWFAGCVLLSVYGSSYLIRQVLEAKLMGDQVGLSPVEMLAAMYVGLNLFGLAGFLLGPVGLMIIEDLVELYWNE